MENQESSTEFSLPCRLLRCKEMYYEGAEDDAYASGAYWCMKTHESFGPDGDIVNKSQCCTGRSCYLS